MSELDFALTDANFLQKVRKRLGLKQSELAERAAVPRPIIANIEAGRRRLVGDVATRLWGTLAMIEMEQRQSKSLFELLKQAGSSSPPAAD